MRQIRFELGFARQAGRVVGVGGSPQLAIGPVVAEGRGATSEGARGFDDRLQGGALPHEVGGLQVVPTP